MDCVNGAVDRKSGVVFFAVNYCNNASEIFIRQDYQFHSATFGILLRKLGKLQLLRAESKLTSPYIKSCSTGVHTYSVVSSKV